MCNTNVEVYMYVVMYSILVNSVRDYISDIRQYMNISNILF